MEGITPALVLGVYSCFALGAASLLLLVIAGGCYLLGRPALKWSAAAILCGCSAAGFLAVAQAPERVGWSESHLLAVCFFLSGSGQCVAAFRNPRNYPAALACAAGSSAFAVGPLAFVHLQTYLRVLLVFTPCLILAVASLVVAVSRPSEPSRRRTALMLVLVNLVVLDLALMVFKTDDNGIVMEENGVITFRSQLADLVGNTHWRWVFAGVCVSVVTSTVFFLIWPAGRGLTLTQRRILIGLAVVAAVGIAAQAGTASVGEGSVRRQIVFGGAAAGQVVSDLQSRIVLPGLIRCRYSVRPYGSLEPEAGEQRFEDDYFWYGIGQVRLRHVLTAVS